MLNVSSETIYRYEFPVSSFESLNNAGMWVSKTTVTPISTSCVNSLPEKLKQENVELRVLESLVPIRNVWNSSLHVSGIRLRNAVDWDS